MRQRIPVQVNASSEPMRMELRDFQGASRIVTVDPVAFGSRDALAGQRREVKPIFASHKQGVW
ncbi:MAG: hypothetical protein ACRD9R_15495 [Pyrinomonadaceae bacterium]